MLRWTKRIAPKWIAPVASLALLMSLSIAKSHAADDVVKAAGKATVTVTVVDAEGKAVPGATVSVIAAPVKGKKTAATTQPAGKAAVLESGVTGADGTFALAKLADGEFVVTARLKGSGTGKSPVTISDGKDQAVSITLKAPKKKAAAPAAN